MISKVFHIIFLSLSVALLSSCESTSTGLEPNSTYVEVNLSSTGSSSGSNINIMNLSSSTPEPSQMLIKLNTFKFGNTGECEVNSQNVTAVWIEDNQSNFIKTLDFRGNKRVHFLRSWVLSTGLTITAANEETIDGYSGATRSDYSDIDLNWNLNNHQDQAVKPGSFVLKMNGSCDYVVDQALAEVNFQILEDLKLERDNLDSPFFKIESWELK